MTLIRLVRYLLGASVSQVGNITWASQTYGEFFESDGRPVGTENIETVTCSSATGTSVCTIKVPAPGAALVFLTSETAAAPSQTFATTALTKTRNTATVAPSVLATSNGHKAIEDELGSTSPDANKNGGQGRGALIGGGVAMSLAVITGWLVLEARL